MDASEASIAWSRQARFAGLIVCLVTFSLYSTWIAVRFGFDTPPSTTGDELSYDSIAWELSHGNGFSVDYNNAEFRRPYDQAAIADPALFSISQTPSGPVAYRPPLFPLVMSFGNAIAGRQFYLIRIFNLLCTAATAGIISWFLFREFGALPLIVVMLLFWGDVRTRLYSRAILTEPLACLLCTMMTVLMVHLARRSDTHRVILVILAVVMGLSILTRSIVIVWLPGIILVLWILFRRWHSATCCEAIFRCCLFLFVTLLTISPWAIRNTLLLGKFAPMGTQGQMELSAGYSDVAWRHNGVWQNLATHHYFNDVDQQNMSTIEFELVRAKKSMAYAFAWAKANPRKLPLLAMMKVGNELRPHSVVEWLLLLLAGVGAVIYRDRKLTAVLLALLLVNLSAVAATWSVEGRFLVPQLFVFYVLAGAGLHALRQRFRKLPAVAGTT